MIHPSQIFTPTQSRQAEAPKLKIEDLKNWRDSDLLDLVELICELVQSEDWKNNSQSLLERAQELRLPCSLTLLLLNSLNRLERILITNDAPATEQVMRDMPNVTALARELGLGGVFTKEVQAIWQGTKAPKPIGQPSTQQVNESKSTQPEMRPIAQVQEYAPTECRITTTQTPNGRQWKIGGQLIAEVEKTQLGHIGKMFSGSFCNPTRPYREYESAATQCREYTEGVLKMLKTIPR